MLTGSASNPPYGFGCSSLKNPVSCRALTDSSGTFRASSVSWARSRRTGRRSRTPAITCSLMRSPLFLAAPRLEHVLVFVENALRQRAVDPRPAAGKHAVGQREPADEGPGTASHGGAAGGVQPGDRLPRRAPHRAGVLVDDQAAEGEHRRGVTEVGPHRDVD